MEVVEQRPSGRGLCVGPVRFDALSTDTLGCELGSCGLQHLVSRRPGLRGPRLSRLVAGDSKTTVLRRFVHQAKAAIFTVQGEAGPTDIEATLLDQAGHALCSAYYVSIRRLEPAK